MYRTITRRLNPEDGNMNISVLEDLRSCSSPARNCIYKDTKAAAENAFGKYSYYETE
jgi:hypothetical protein